MTIDILSEPLKHKRHICSRVFEPSLPTVQPDKPTFVDSWMPTELWEEVFWLCLPSRGAVLGDYDSAPITFIRVCRLWQAIVLASPKLWSAMALNTEDFVRDEDRTLAMMEAWLCRSKTCGVSLVVSAEDGFKEGSRSPCLLEFSTLLVAHSRRWRHLELWLPAPWFESLYLFNGHFASLVSLRMEAIACRRAALGPTAFDWTRGAPLQRLAISGLMFPPKSPFISHSRITELVLLPRSFLQGTLFTLDDILDLLSQGTQLRRLVCLVEDRMLRQDDQVYSRVEELDLMLMDGSGQGWGLQINKHRQLDHFFALLQTPALKKLSMGYDPTATSSTTWPHDSFLSYLARSSSNLEHLTLKHLPLFETQIIQYLQKAASLTHLVVEVQSTTGSQRVVGDLLLAALTFMDWRYPLVPRLKSIDFRNCGKRCSEMALLLMLEARSIRNPVSRLKSFRYTASRAPCTLLSKLGEWSRRGKRIDFEVTIQ